MEGGEGGGWGGVEAQENLLSRDYSQYSSTSEELDALFLQLPLPLLFDWFSITLILWIAYPLCRTALDANKPI